jgi:hypothetical protein
MRVVALGALGLFAAACHDESCLTGTCELPCPRVSFGCSEQPLYIGPVSGAPAAYRLTGGNAGDEDLLISNGIVTAVIAKLDAPLDLAPTGGTLIDFGVAGGLDDVTVVYQLAGILPEDAFAYRTQAIREQPGRVALTLRGTLDGRPDVDIVTHYELTSCDQGLRVRSELFNGSADTQAFLIADASHWGKRRIVPFVPVAGQGYTQPELDLLELTSLWKPYDYVGAATPAKESPGYATLACDREALYGVNDLEIAALGSPIELIEPGDTLALERMWFAGGTGQGPAPAMESALAARLQLFPETPARVVRGRIVAGGAPFGGDARRASIVIKREGTPVGAVVPGADGTFSAMVRTDGPVSYEVSSFGRVVATIENPGFAGVRSGAEGRRGATIDGVEGDAGDIVVPAPASVELHVARDGEPIHALVAFHPADEATRAAVAGTFHGQLTACAPWLGPPHGASPACNQVLVAPEGTTLDVPAGHYRVFASAGPEHTLASAEVTLAPGDAFAIALAVRALDVAPAGWLSADLHVHGRASFDSGLPDDDRVRSFAAAGVDVIAATDHDVIGDYSETVSRLGLDGDIAVMGGLEATQIIPWMDIPGEDLPRVIGHFNFWPLRRLPSAPRAGAPWDELMEPGELFDIMEPLVGAGGMMQMNHPWDEPFFGRDLGYLRAIKFDPRRAVDDPASNNGVLLERPLGRHRNSDWNAIEILNGADQVELQKARVVWHALLAQGMVAAGTGNSDSHGMTDAQLGWARNWVDAGTTVTGFDAAKFNAAVRDGRVVAGNGIVIAVEVGAPTGERRGLGLTPYAARPGDVLAITVKAAPWIPVHEVRVVTSRGTRVVATGLAQPADPFGTDGLVRYTAALPLAELVDRDDFVIVEAGLPYPEAADFDDDGVPDTTDNNGDGIVDERDIEPDEDAGPFSVPPDPTDERDPRYWVTRVVPGAWPMGFTNPILVDLDGSGWNAPGLR